MSHNVLFVLQFMAALLGVALARILLPDLPWVAWGTFLLSTPALLWRYWRIRRAAP